MLPLYFYLLQILFQVTAVRLSMVHADLWLIL